MTDLFPGLRTHETNIDDEALRLMSYLNDPLSETVQEEIFKCRIAGNKMMLNVLL